ncbi:MAG: SRPBCC family protein [Cytophagales bacterium]|nr:SRPBCC family protein [Cytophaga sp.]
MKALKIIGIGLCLFIALSVGVSFFLPDHYSVEKSIVINAPADTIYGNIADFHNWPQWSTWYEMDTETRYTYTGEYGKAGSVQKWESKKTGKGAIP